jgi:Zn-dependent M28 family amino/carboxypeptidase
MRLWDVRALKHVIVLLVIIVSLGVGGWLVMMRMPGRSFRGPLPPLAEAERTISAALRRDVEKLATEIGQRNVYRPAGYQAAADFIEASFRQAGLATQRQTYTANQEACVNVAAEMPGGERAAEIVVVGAHYDSVLGSPAANDNGSGVAAVLALARKFAGQRPARTLRFVAFANEEPPFFQAEGMGSLVYARSCRERGDNIVAMLSLETMGYFTDVPGSQRYPPVVGWFYPSQGDFLGVVGNRESGSLVRQVAESFRRHSDLPCEGASLPGGLPGIGWSDHWAFWQEGYPGVMITDTAPFRYPHYHESTDTPEELDYTRFARAVLGLERAVRELAGIE